MMVSPKHQRKGIGRKLIEWGINKADEERIVGYLNARPAAMKLYQAAGFEPVAPLNCVIPEDDEQFIVPTGYAMLRKPRPLADEVK
jgi:GNAT superfamily N-acetyltransferase